jgi:hypothetical protein
MNFWYTKSSSDEEGDGEDLTSCREGFGEIFRSQLSWGMRRRRTRCYGIGNRGRSLRGNLKAEGNLWRIERGGFDIESFEEKL